MQFIWRTYTEDDYAALPDNAGAEIWTYSGPLICVEIVEMHRAERVLRQFGMVQGIPPNPSPDEDTLHSYNRRTAARRNWYTAHAAYIDVWERRTEQLVEGRHTDRGRVVVGRGYRDWYINVTRLRLTPQPAFVDSGFQPESTGWFAEIVSISYINAI